MNDFKKAALATALTALSVTVNNANATALTEATNVIIGCTVPGNTTAAATVYSIDAFDSDAAAVTGVPSWLKAGASCSRAVNYMLTVMDLNSVSNQVANGGYTLQSFSFSDQAGDQNNLITNTLPVSMIGCAAPASGTAGATIYSVDTQNSAASTANTGITLTALGGNPCSSGLATVYTLGSGDDGVINTTLNVRTADGAYSLQQYIIQ